MKRSYARSLSIASLPTALALAVASASPASAYNGCTGSDCIVYDLSTQDACTEVTESASYDSRWLQGLSLQADQAIKGGHIVAFKLQWFGGGWSSWIVPGVNDIDTKYNTGSGKLRRMWSYFYDHNHSYIICSKTAGAF